MKFNLIYSTDSDLLQSTLIVFNTDRCFYAYVDECENNVILHTFDLLNSNDLVNSWFNLDDVNNFCGTNYTKETEDFVNLTNDICSYYGAINLDSYPENLTLDSYETFLNTNF